MLRYTSDAITPIAPRISPIAPTILQSILIQLSNTGPAIDREYFETHNVKLNWLRNAGQFERQVMRSPVGCKYAIYDIYFDL